MAGPRFGGAAQETVTWPKSQAARGAGAAGRGRTAAEAVPAPRPFTARTLKLWATLESRAQVVVWLAVPALLPGTGVQKSSWKGVPCGVQRYSHLMIERSPGLVHDNVTAPLAVVLARSPAGAAGTPGDGDTESEGALSAPLPATFTPRTVNR